MQQRPQAARAEAARAGRWWPLVDSNGMTFFFVHYEVPAVDYQVQREHELPLYKYTH